MLNVCALWVDGESKTRNNGLQNRPWSLSAAPSCPTDRLTIPLCQQDRVHDGQPCHENTRPPRETSMILSHRAIIATPRCLPPLRAAYARLHAKNSRA